MVRINDYSIIKKTATRYEIYYQNNEFCKYATSLVMALYYVLHMIHCVGTGITHFEDFGYKFKIVDRQLYLDF